MPSSHGVLQGYSGVIIADDKKQIIVSVEAFGTGAEQSTLKPMIDQTRENFKTIDEHEDIFKNTVLTADSGFHSEENMKMLSGEEIDAYVADNGFRKRDPLFKTAERHRQKQTKGIRKCGKNYFQPSDFKYDPEKKN